MTIDTPATHDDSATLANAAPALVVDDSAFARRWVGHMVQQHARLRPIYASNGIEALAVVQREAPVLVLTDLNMPDMDGLQLVEEMRKLHPLIPVILITAHGSEEIALKALQRGAASYVSKKNLNRDLPGTFEQVLATVDAARFQNRLLDCMNAVDMHLVIKNDPELVPALIAEMRKVPPHLQACDQREAIRVDVALHEALLNGIHHGNLEVSSELREDGEAPYNRLIQERRGAAPYRDRRLHVHARFTRDAAEYQIRDEGPGFDPSKLPDPTDPENLGMPSGRGLLLIRTFMDEVRFNDAGNQVTLVKRSRARGS